MLFVHEIVTILRAIRCQTSPDYSLIRYGKPGKRLKFDYAGDGGFLYTLSSTILRWESDQGSCSAVHMGLPLQGSDIPYGSFAFLWPVFMRLCLNSFVEALSSALQGRPVVPEEGMSIFEHSLAFAEAESMISQSIGLGLFGFSKSSQIHDEAPAGAADKPVSPIHLMTRSQILDRMNVTPELLLIALISCCNSLTTNLFDVFGKQSKFRLFNTTLWGLCYMSAIVWGLLHGSSSGGEMGILKLPTACIVDFVPHLFILLGILTCVMIYGLALSIAAFSLPGDSAHEPLSIRQRFALAHENMQGSVQIRSIRFNRHDDFYTSLLRIGFTALTAAREAVFLNEGKGVVARPMTWLEEDRLFELQATRNARPAKRSWGVDPAVDGPFDENAINFDLADPHTEWESGYSREKRSEKPKKGSRPLRSQNNSGGVGAFRGAARYYDGLSFFRAIFHLWSKWLLLCFSKVLDKLGIETRPSWLKSPDSRRREQHAMNEGLAQPLDFWILTDDGELELPESNDFDVETEMRKRELTYIKQWKEQDESRLDEKLYSWWKAGGSWGNQDYSPDYQPSISDPDDSASVSSSARSVATESEWEDEEDEEEDEEPDDGRRTPTQSRPFFPSSQSRDVSALDESLYNPRTLARLLDPRDAESKQEARILAAHLLADQDSRVMTRSRYRNEQEKKRAQVLLSSRLYRDFAASSASSQEKRKPTPDEEMEILERLILSRRTHTPSSAPSPPSSSPDDAKTWASGASGLGPDGPPCVVCQTSPRSIITWPCRCLCVCEECRVSLAMNNFASCVTCRQEVSGFLRLWVP